MDPSLLYEADVLAMDVDDILDLDDGWLRRDLIERLERADDGTFRAVMSSYLADAAGALEIGPLSPVASDLLDRTTELGTVPDDLVDGHASALVVEWKAFEESEDGRGYVETVADGVFYAAVVYALVLLGRERRSTAVDAIWDLADRVTDWDKPGENLRLQLRFNVRAARTAG
jgi:hypothetical protein